MIIKTPNIISSHLFITSQSLRNSAFRRMYRRLMRNQWQSPEVLQHEQNLKLNAIVEYSYACIPYYHNLFNYLGLLPKDVKKIEDLNKLPILTKDIIKTRPEDFIPINIQKIPYYNQATGGSTGSPLFYRIDKQEVFLADMILYRGWGHGGYQLGDSMAVLGGTSLAVNKTSSFIQKTKEFALNFHKLSAFDMGESELERYRLILNSLEPKFIRGYASSLYFFAKWLENNDLKIHSPKSVFTTAEKLYPHIRETLTRVFSCDVYDGYGLNDGGVTAFECSEHSGLHIDTERSILEVVDETGNQVGTGRGKILATTLHNYAMPFIRYESGDIADLSDEICPCGRGSMLLKNIVGRDTEMLTTPCGQRVHGAALFNSIFQSLSNTNLANNNTIQEFQIIQKRKDTIEIIIAGKKETPQAVLNYIESIIQQRFPGWSIIFRHVDITERTLGGKYKFIINEVQDE